MFFMLFFVPVWASVRLFFTRQQSLTLSEHQMLFPVGVVTDFVGGIAASATVVMLLSVTLIALLAYYLRSRQEDAAGPSSPPPPPASPAGGFSNETYECEPEVSKSDSEQTHLSKQNPVAVTYSCLFTCLQQQDHVVVQTVDNHPMAAGFNNVTVSMLCFHTTDTFPPGHSHILSKWIQ